jgi:hypothetical protein
MSDASHHFFMLGGQYYVAGRFATFAALNPVIGNLLHHAIEMFIKGAISKSKSLDELKTIGHKLPKLWDELKRQAKDEPLARFDGVIANLDTFEEVRYPDKIMTDGMASIIAITKAAAVTTQQGAAANSVRQYKLCLEEIDELAAIIFKIANRNPVGYLPRLKEDARCYLNQDNASFSVPGPTAPKS